MQPAPIGFTRGLLRLPTGLGLVRTTPFSRLLAGFVRATEVGQAMLLPVDHLCWACPATFLTWAVRLASQLIQLLHHYCGDCRLAIIEQPRSGSGANELDPS